MVTHAPRRPRYTRTVRLLAGLVLAALLGSPSAAAACRCVETTYEAEVERASAIFEGVVDSVELDPATRSRIVRIGVTQAWRGVRSEHVEVVTAADEAGCGYAFEVGRAYLVYGSGMEGARHRVSLCSRTRPMDEAGEDRSALGSGVVPVDIVDEVIDPVRPARTPPSRAGCASCSAGARTPPGPLVSVGVSLAWALARRRRA